MTGRIAQDNFWELFPKILAIDAKVSILIELITFNDFSDKEIIRIIENDYRSYFKELCGYDLGTDPIPSMVFNIL